MATDPLSDVLALVNARSVISAGVMAGGAWALRFPPPEKIKFFAVVRGDCWLALEGEAQPLRVATGDVVLLTARRPFLIASDLSVAPTAAAEVFAGKVDGIARHGEGEEFFLLGGHVTLDANGGGLLADVLPAVLHVRGAADEATALRWLLDQLVREVTADRPGASLAATQLTQLMFLQILRVHLAASAPPAAGWLRALGDERIAPALRLMHGDPGHAWQLGELARAVAMSRTSFAQRFKSVAGVAPLTYLHNWRMRLAERALREGGTPVSALARTLGYTSESAFSNAFKRMVGVAPKRYQTAKVITEHFSGAKRGNDLQDALRTGSISERTLDAIEAQVESRRRA